MKFILLLLSLFSTSVFAKDTSTLIYNETKNEIVVGNNLNVTRPIASLTKLMTAMVSLDHDTDLQRKISMPGSGHIPRGEYTREDLMTAMLVRSDNGAAEAIAADYPGGRKEFIKAMNSKAENIGMMFTRFSDPSGLSSNNTSTVVSIGTMLQAASKYPFIKETTVKKQISIQRKKYTIILDNTNKTLLYDFNEIQLSKTGYTSFAGWSVGLVLEKDQQKFSVVVLGAPTKDKRYELAKKMIEKYFSDLALERDTISLEEKNFYEKLKDLFYLR